MEPWASVRRYVFLHSAVVRRQAFGSEREPLLALGRIAAYVLFAPRVVHDAEDLSRSGPVARRENASPEKGIENSGLAGAHTAQHKYMKPGIGNPEFSHGISPAAVLAAVIVQLKIPD